MNTNFINFLKGYAVIKVKNLKELNKIINFCKFLDVPGIDYHIKNLEHQTDLSKTNKAFKDSESCIEYSKDSFTFGRESDYKRMDFEVLSVNDIDFYLLKKYYKEEIEEDSLEKEILDLI